MQIIQFLAGVSYASLHSFVSYTIPVLVETPISEVITSAATAASSVASSAVAAATSAGVGALIKKLLFRAAGEEGLAENAAGTYNTVDHLSQLKATHGIPETAQYHTEYRTIPCIDTEGQTFAIWLNVFYLTPLTFLFARFFYKSYMRRGQKGNRKVIVDGKGANVDALKGMERKVLDERPTSVSETNGNGVHVINGNGKKPNGKVL